MWWLVSIATSFVRYLVTKPKNALFVLCLFTTLAPLSTYPPMVVVSIPFWLIYLIFCLHDKSKRTAEDKGKQLLEQAATDPSIALALQMRPLEKHGFIFGEKDGMTVAKPEQLDGHVLVVGSPGSGKSSCLAIPSLLAWQGRVFAIDVKGELYDKTKTERKSIKVFNPLDETALGYDPFAVFEHSIDQAQDAQAIAIALIPSSPNADDSFWVNSARDLLTGALLHYYNEGSSFIDTVLNVLRVPVPELIRTIRNSKTKKCISYVNGFDGDGNDKMTASVYSTLSTHLRVFENGTVQKAFSKDEYISPATLEEHDVYITIPSEYIKHWKGAINLITSQFMAYFDNRPERAIAASTPTPILFLLDEFARFGKIEGIEDALATLRSKNITICIILQSLSQLDKHYGQYEREAICDSCSYQAVLCSMTTKTQNEFANLVGKYVRKKRSDGEAFDNLGGKTGRQRGETEEREFIIDSWDFSRLDDIVLISPQGFFKVNKAPYYAATEQRRQAKTAPRATKLRRVKKRSLFVINVLSICTLGIYGVYTMVSITNDISHMKEAGGAPSNSFRFKLRHVATFTHEARSELMEIALKYKRKDIAESLVHNHSESSVIKSFNALAEEHNKRYHQ